jgi:hypothetical protein
MAVVPDPVTAPDKVIVWFPVRNAVELKAFVPKEEVENVRAALVVVVETEMKELAEETEYEARPVEVTYPAVLANCKMEDVARLATVRPVEVVR